MGLHVRGILVTANRAQSLFGAQRSRQPSFLLDSCKSDIRFHARAREAKARPIGLARIMRDAFKDVDFYSIEELFSKEELEHRDAMRAWVTERFLPTAREHYAAGTFPMELAPEMAQRHAFGATIKGYGCAGLSSIAYGLIMQELERGDSGLRTFASVQGALAMNAIAMFGSEEQKQRWLGPMARGERIGCFGLTEPDFGSNP